MFKTAVFPSIIIFKQSKDGGSYFSANFPILFLLILESNILIVPHIKPITNKEPSGENFIAEGVLLKYCYINDLFVFVSNIHKLPSSPTVTIIGSSGCNVKYIFFFIYIYVFFCILYVYIICLFICYFFIEYVFI
jgi:hypothetical protein